MVPLPAAGVPPRCDSNVTSTSATSTMTVPREQQQQQLDEQQQQQQQPLANGTALLTMLAKPIPFSEGRDVSSSSREGLRRHIQSKQKSLTSGEIAFLDELVVSGNEIEVQLAMERLQDEDLFFEYQTPRHQDEMIPSGFTSGSGSEMTRSASWNEHEHEHEHEYERDIAPSPRPSLERQSSCGSQRRLQILQERKQQSKSLAKDLWKAHESGLHISLGASQRNLMMMRKRESSTGSNSYSNSNSNSFGSCRRMAARRSSDIFRARRAAAASQKPTSAPPRPYRRSQSLVAGVPPIPPPRSLQEGRRSSTGSRKSVTFHHQTDGAPKRRPSRTSLLRRSQSDQIMYSHLPEDTTTTTTTATTAIQEPSSTSTLTSSSQSVTSIPSLHPAHPIRSESNGSMGSIPSLHHGHPLVDDASCGSIPSLHHGHPIRSDSIGSIPSLHHGHSVHSLTSNAASIPSLHHGHPIHSPSAASIPSLHHGHPIRSTSLGSIPSLHHGHLLVDDSTSTVGENGPELVVPKEQGVGPFSASQDIAAAWLQQQQQQPQPVSTVHDEGYSSLPENVTFPSIASTETTQASTLPSPQEEDDDEQSCEDVGLNLSSLSSPAKKPLLMREASKNFYQGEGIEVTELETTTTNHLPPRPCSFRRLTSMDLSVLTCNSFDTGYSGYYGYQRDGYDNVFRDTTIATTAGNEDRMLRKCLSDEDMSNLFLGSSANLLISTSKPSSTERSDKAIFYADGDDDDDESSWDMHSQDSGINRYDSWNVIKDEYVNGYGGGDTLGFKILGTSGDDESAQPHVLSPPLMESLQAFLPYSKSGENFFLKYSMVRDGASLHTFLKRARGCQYSILALETIDGEVFGCFTAAAWRKNWNYFGTGESFLWRMRQDRRTKTTGILEQAQLESEIDVFPFTGENRLVQLCTHDRIAIGGGTPAEKKTPERPEHEWGFGLAIESHFLQGTSSPCVTFGSPSLSKSHANGTPFEIVNVELWTLTPCLDVEEAEKLELGKLFLERN